MRATIWEPLNECGHGHNVAEAQSQAAKNPSLVPFPGVNLARGDENKAAGIDWVASAVAHEGAIA
jgi:hypothetical protein